MLLAVNFHLLKLRRTTMSANEGITLEQSLCGFVALHENILYVRNQGLLVRNDEEFKRDQKSVVLISGGECGNKSERKS